VPDLALLVTMLKLHHAWYFCTPAILFYGSMVDMRKGFNDLAGLVWQHVGHDLLSRDMFVFTNRRRESTKLLMWDKASFAIYNKQLKQGAFLSNNGSARC
jgi:transposase